MIDFSDDRPSLDRMNDLVVFLGNDNGNTLRFTIGVGGLGKFDPTADVQNGVDVYSRNRAAIQEVAGRVYRAETRTQLLQSDFDGSGGEWTIDDDP